MSIPVYKVLVLRVITLNKVFVRAFIFWPTTDGYFINTSIGVAQIAKNGCVDNHSFMIYLHQ